MTNQNKSQSISTSTLVINPLEKNFGLQYNNRSADSIVTNFALYKSKVVPDSKLAKKKFRLEDMFECINNPEEARAWFNQYSLNLILFLCKPHRQPTLLYGKIPEPIENKDGERKEYDTNKLLEDIFYKNTYYENDLVCDPRQLDLVFHMIYISSDSTGPDVVKVFGKHMAEFDEVDSEWSQSDLSDSESGSESESSEDQ